MATLCTSASHFLWQLVLPFDPSNFWHAKSTIKIPRSLSSTCYRHHQIERYLQWKLHILFHHRRVPWQRDRKNSALLALPPHEVMPTRAEHPMSATHRLQSDVLFPYKQSSRMTLFFDYDPSTINFFNLTIFGRLFYMAEYGVDKPVNLIGKMADTFIIAGKET